ncbi:type III secretion system stator protein SctL [Burkholderia metallica]|uniref:type III secretion system stator protein SctL n=1 Tax=Burkholderia metallica TaxID=488729 RepID=UPI000D1BFEF5|nr:type III secretion system stator protein SctL [Burkholderia metallica]
MVVWLRSDEGDVGVDADVIRRDAYATLVELDAAYAGMRDERARMLRDAQDEAACIVAAARDEMNALAHAAQIRFDRSARLGYAAGRRRALDDWNAQVVQAALDDQETLSSAHERLTDILMRACEHVVRDCDRDAFYAKIAHALDRSLAEAKFLRVDVHPHDEAAARAAFGGAAGALGWTLSLDVVAAPGVNVGSCVCEWDAGVLECSLPEQLASLRRALHRVLASGFSASQQAEVA